MNIAKALILSTTLLLSACGGTKNHTEAKTFGIENNKWSKMSPAEKHQAEHRYNHEIQVVEQRKFDERLREHNEKQAQLKLEERILTLEQNERERAMIEKLATRLSEQQQAQLATPAPAKIETTVSEQQQSEG